LLLKNPAHTGRVAELLEIYPDAKFVYIHRDPRDVIRSTRIFYQKQCLEQERLRLSTLNDLNIPICQFYHLILEKFLRTKDKIPKKQYFEICFEDFEKRPMEILEELYSVLEIPNFENMKPKYESYFAGLKSYEKNTLDPIPEECEKYLQQHCQQFLKMYSKKETK